MHVLLISGSLNPESNSRLLIQEAHKKLKEKQVESTYLDLKDYPLPLCDGDKAYNDPNVAKLSAIIKKADVILLGVPIYNFDMNAALKNLVELTGSAWENKIVGFLCAAGGRSSYMSVVNFGNDLMLDFRCLIIPRFIYAVGNDFSDESVSNPEILERIDKLLHEAQVIASSGYATAS